jgi:L-lysine exporter family protein LysE/ArgO
MFHKKDSFPYIDDAIYRRDVTLALAPMLAGLGTGAGLIVAIGAQNAFVLRQGVARAWVPTVVAVCVLSDLVLIAAGVAGIGALTTRAPWFLEVVRWGGVAFLLTYAATSAWRAVRPASLTVQSGQGTGGSRRRAALTAAGLTWLNPHVYLDTVVLVGGVAATHGDPGRWLFGAGAAVASAIWFPLIGFGARSLQAVFARPAAWRVLDLAIAVQLVVIAIAMAAGA